MDELAAPCLVEKVVFASFPVLFVEEKKVDKILVVFELWVNNFDVLLELP